MAVVLNPQSLGKGNKINLNTISTNRSRRNQRVKEDLDKVFIESETRARAQFLNFPYIDLYGFPIDTNHLKIISRAEAAQTKIGPFTMNNKEVYLATYDLNADGQQEIFHKLLSNGYTYKIFLCSELSFRKLLTTYDHIIDTPKLDDNISISSETVENLKNQNLSLAHLSKMITNQNVSDKIETILSSALLNNASDIHFEPEKDVYLVRLRLDGVLHTFAELKTDDQKTIESRIKLLSGLKININNVPQDGRFSFKAENREIDVRVSMLPSNYGYSIVMRLLGTGSVALELESLGFVGEAQERVKNAISKPQGMILTTGPTGSGKTTTLYTFLQTLNDGESKIITLEDPIEYKLDGISQTQIDMQAGYTFSSGLRSILRQDPDILMVGEIRDAETAEIAVQASLTGHLVLSTLHTNDAAGAIPRLMEMKVRGFLLADSLSVLIAQRLVRRLCKSCMREEVLSDEQRNKIQEELSLLPENARAQLPSNLVFYTSDGCEACNNLGYKGRIGVYEVLTITPGLRNLLSEQFPSIQQVRDIATREGMVTMRQDALLKALQGVTDLKEIERSVG